MELSTDEILMQRDGAIGRVIFNQPAKLNAISLEM
jgi:enoyl-CoA hydratase/carnithine racemase